jgi:hypothetical protein
MGLWCREVTLVVVVCFGLGAGCTTVGRRAVLELVASPAFGRLVEDLAGSLDGGSNDQPRVP